MENITCDKTSNLEMLVATSFKNAMSVVTAKWAEGEFSQIV